MKIYIFALLVVTAVAIALPTKDEDKAVSPNSLPANENESLKLEEAPVKEHHRVRRFTCDLLSGLNWNHTPCALHCIARGKTGGRCNSDGVCVCRAKSWAG